MKLKILNNIIIPFMLVSFLSLAYGSSSNINRSHFTTNVTKMEPADILTEFNSSHGKISFFSEIVNCKNCEIKHEWYIDNKLTFDKSTISKYQRYRWWSTKNITNAKTVNVKIYINDKFILARHIKLSTPEMQQQYQAPIPQQIKRHEKTRCDRKIEYYTSRAKEHPESRFYSFFLKKWKSRCK